MTRILGLALKMIVTFGFLISGAFFFIQLLIFFGGQICASSQAYPLADEEDNLVSVGAHAFYPVKMNVVPNEENRHELLAEVFSLAMTKNVIKTLPEFYREVLYTPRDLYWKLKSKYYEVDYRSSTLPDACVLKILYSDESEALGAMSSATPMKSYVLMWQRAPLCLFADEESPKDYVLAWKFEVLWVGALYAGALLLVLILMVLWYMVPLRVKRLVES